ncbi:MAG: YkgJ family cysteine cluster protein [Phycisphaerae bacterium]|nr:YkgJ family cysteine cluster protein [Phycisphaerae bacterium]
MREAVVSGSGTAPWYAKGLRFACTRCGNCCSGASGFVWVGPTEIERIAAYLGLSVEAFHRKHLRRAGWGRSLLEKPNGDCEFLERRPDGTTGCLIHPVRPIQCRTWPFWKSNLESPEAWKRTAAGCPGIGRSEAYPLPIIKAALQDNGRRPL